MKRLHWMFLMLFTVFIISGQTAVFAQDTVVEESSTVVTEEIPADSDAQVIGEKTTTTTTSVEETVVKKTTKKAKKPEYVK